MALSAQQLSRMRGQIQSRTMTDSCTFKLKDGTTPTGGGPFDCRVGAHKTSATEKQEGGRTTEFELCDLLLPVGTTVQPFWRVEVTLVGTATPILYMVKDAGSPTSSELVRKVVIERVR